MPTFSQGGKALSLKGLTQNKGVVDLTPPALAKIENFGSASHGWVKVGTNGVYTASDTSVFSEGTQSIKLDTTGSASCGARRTSISPVYDFSGKFVIVKFRVNDYTRLSTLAIGLSDGAVFTQATIAAAAYAINVNDEWITAQVPKAAFSSQVTNFAAINAITITLTPLAQANPLTCNLQWVGSRDVPTSQCVVPQFDDGYVETYSEAFAYMQPKGIPATLWVIYDQVDSNVNFCTGTQLRAMQAAGWEMGAHAARLTDHDLTNGFADLSDADFNQECIDMIAASQALGLGTPKSFAWPKGKWGTPSKLAIARTYFPNIRAYRELLTPAIAEQESWFPADRQTLRPMGITGGASPMSSATFATNIDTALTAKMCPMPTWHRIRDATGSVDTNVANFRAEIDKLYALSNPKKTVAQFMSRGPY